MFNWQSDPSHIFTFFLFQKKFKSITRFNVPNFVLFGIARPEYFNLVSVLTVMDILNVI